MLNNNFGDDFKKGHRLSAADIKRIAAELKRQQHLSVSAPLQLSSGAHGNHISLNLPAMAEEVYICKAKKASGTYLSLKDWSDAWGGESSSAQNVWDFEMGTIAHSNGTASARLNFTGNGNYVKALNLCTFEYVPEGAIVYVCKVQGSYYCEFSMPEMLYGTIGSDLVGGGSAVVMTLTSTHGYIANGSTITISTSFVPSGKKLTSGAFCWAAKKGGYTNTTASYRIIGSNRALVDA